MSAMNKTYLVRASLLAAVAIFLGIALSVVVYQSNQSVKSNAIDLVSHRIPILISINELIADLSEQERVIYEYYRSQDSTVFTQSSQAIKKQFSMHLASIESQERFKDETLIIVKGQAEIESLFTLFHQGMLIEQDNWDELREILENVSTLRRDLLPTLKSIEQQTQHTVEEGHLATLKQMAISHKLVIIYGFVIVFIAVVVAWYIRQYMHAHTENTRLALFSHRNPNPILSVNNLGEVVFSNPACGTLLLSVGYQINDHNVLLPNNFMALREQLGKQKEANIVVEQPLKNRILQVRVYWHKEVDAYDIHIIDVTERRFAEDKVKHLAFYNQETNLPNQYKFNSDIDDQINSVEPFSVGVFAIRHFDEKVSTLGVEATESLVKAVAAKISSSLHHSVNFYQTGESQFGLLCSKSYKESDLHGINLAISIVVEQSIVTDCGEFFVELDFGFACYPMHGRERNDLIRNAHSALAIAIANEHENYCVYNDSLSDQKQKNSELVNKLRYAVEKNEFFLVFQPQLDIQNHRVTGIETLVRWESNNTLISPVDFIPLAEQSGLIIPIGQWILEQACKFAKQLVDLGYIDIIVAVNVSPRQFSHPNFCQMVQEVINKIDLPAANLELEITEGVFMHNEAHTLSVLNQLKASGFHLSIDDFGTGYSSLSYLKRFPIDKLKIDQSFIRDCHHDDEDKAIIETIISLGRSLHLSLIAEGVEEESHVEYLRGLGCDEIQGYWFSKPILPKQLITLLKEKGGDICVEPQHNTLIS